MSESERQNKPRRRPFAVIAALVAFALITAGLVRLALDASDRDSRPQGTLEDVLALRERDELNVLFILVDTLRADRLGVYGYERDTSPNLDALAATGIRFAQQVSQSSWTKCSMASLWTGLYPVRSRVLRAYDVVSPEALMPAEVFQEAGFRTAGIWRNGWIDSNFGFSQGFEVYLSPRSQRRKGARLVRLENPNHSLDGDDADILESAFGFLRSHSHERWFLYLHMMDVHQYAYSEESALFGTSYSDSYDNSIHWVDSLLGILFDRLDEMGLRENTLIVFSADHGEAFGEHEGEGHARNVYGEVTQTPLIMSFPFQLDPGIVVEARTENVDLWPTVLELLGLPALPDVDGRSMVPEIIAAARGETPPEGGDDGLAFAQIDQAWGRTQEGPKPMVAVNQGQWRLIFRAGAPERTELYDKSIDHHEQQDIAGEQPEVTEELTDRAVGYLKSPPPPWGDAPSVEVDEMQMNQLRALGYGVQ
ncbi:MAG: sulfatase [Deltaproteobacteria bacterium]|nr:sulfatase [Deltaproteobacteria bacterium]